MDGLETLRLLCDAPGPSGFERPAAERAAELLQPYTDELQIDRMGNVIGVKRCGRPGAGKLLLDAHLDEVGLIITGIENGFLRFRALGGVDMRLLPAQEITVLADPTLLGVVACLPPHVLEPGEGDQAFPPDQLCIDIGMDQAQAEQCVRIGTPAVFRGPFTRLGTHQVCSRALDDRAGFAALLRTAELLHGKQLDVDLFYLGSVREELNGAGAVTGAYGICPDWCVAVDVTHGRTPDADKDETFPLGGGAAIGVGPNMTRWLSDRLRSLAKQRSIPHCIEVMAGHSGTNGWHFQVSRAGIPTAVLSVPLKYMHTPAETIDLRDLDAAARLLCALAVTMEQGAEKC